MVDANSSVSRCFAQLEEAIKKQTEEKQFWFKNLLDYADWLRKHIHAIESYVGHTLLRIEADALATAMRKADERHQQYESAIDDINSTLQTLKQLIQTNEPTSPSTVANAVKLRPQISAQFSRSISSSGCVSDLSGSYEMSAVNKMMNRRKRKLDNQVERAKRIFHSDLNALTQSKIVNYSRHKSLIRHVNRHLRAASNEVRKHRGETWTTNCVVENLVEVESGTKKLGDNQSEFDFYNTYGFVQTATTLATRNRAEARLRARSTTDIASCLWHGRTGLLLSFTKDIKEHFKEALIAYQPTETNEHDRSLIYRDLEVTHTCLVEKLGIVCLYNYRISAYSDQERFLDLAIFDKSSGKLLTVPDIFADIIPYGKVVLSDDANHYATIDYYVRLVSTRSDRFVVFNSDSGVYREFALDKTSDGNSSKKGTRPEIRLRDRFVLTVDDENSKVVEFCVNGRARHAIARYGGHALLISIEPRARVRAFIDTQKIGGNGNGNGKTLCAISDGGISMILTCSPFGTKVHFYDLNGFLKKIASLSSSFSHFLSGSVFVSSSTNSLQNSQLTLMKRFWQTNEVQYVRFQSVVIQGEMTESRDPNPHRSVEKFPDLALKISEPILLKVQFRGLPFGLRLFYSPENRHFYALNYDSRNPLAVYKSYLDVNSEPGLPNFFFQHWVTLELRKAQKITGLCALGANWVVVIVDNAFLLTLEARSGKLVNTVRFSLDESHEDAAIASVDSTHVYVSHRGSETVLMLECEASVLNWRVVNHRTFQRNTRICNLFYDKYSSRLAILYVFPFEVRIFTKSLQLVKKVPLEIIHNKSILLYNTILVYRKDARTICCYDFSRNEPRIFIEINPTTKFCYMECIESSDKKHAEIGINTVYLDNYTEGCLKSFVIKVEDKNQID